jgi:hypothetical protein
MNTAQGFGLAFFAIGQYAFISGLIAYFRIPASSSAFSMLVGTALIHIAIFAVSARTIYRKRLLNITQIVSGIVFTISTLLGVIAIPGNTGAALIILTFSIPSAVLAVFRVMDWMRS